MSLQIQDLKELQERQDLMAKTIILLAISQIITSFTILLYSLSHHG
jgi:hypothetical protein